MVGPARVLRTIFSRPHFIAYQNEVSLEKMILVDSPSAVSYSVVGDSLNCLSIYMYAYKLLFQRNANLF